MIHCAIDLSLEAFPNCSALFTVASGSQLQELAECCLKAVSMATTVSAEDLLYGTHRVSMNTNVLLQHVDAGKVDNMKKCRRTFL